MTDDKTAIRQIKNGDIAGLAALAERYQVAAARAAYLITGDSATADDVTQEAFLRVYRGARHIDETRPFAPYFMRIVANLAIDAAKRGARGESLDDAPEPADPAPTPEAAAEAAELRRAVQGALRTLPPEQRAAVVLRYYFDYTEREVAEALSVPHGTVSWRLSAARKRLGVALHLFAGKR
jgi:RNA polymerase sigma-70 factor (ECF subfamily)